tara:strand:- start:1245 stop:1739 length:495 start_codon:yes stop_codon:yes gene_type:complete
MKTSPYNQLIAVALLSAMVSCSSTSTPTVTRIQVSASSAKSSNLSGDVFNTVNSYRAQKGKNSLERHAGLDQLAQDHCDYLVKNCGGSGTNISHVGFDTRAHNANRYFSIPSVGENIVSSSTKTASHLLNLWVSSKTHEKNMRGSWKYTGIGTATTPDGMVIST